MATPRGGPTKISGSSVRRLSRYYRTLVRVQKQGMSHISSRELAERNGVTSAQVRKDLSTFGTFGKRGLGYPVEGLKDAVAGILGLDRQWPVILVGVGNIGSALLRYGQFRRQGFHFVAAFDVAPDKVGTSIDGVPIYRMERLADVVAAEGVEIGILSVPAPNAQEVCDQMVEAGVRAILSFAPITLDTPEEVTVRYEDMAIELETLSYALTRGDLQEG